MSLERELVFQKMDEGLTQDEIMAIVEAGREIDLHFDSRRVMIAISQYKAQKEVQKLGGIKKARKAAIKSLIEEERRKIEDNYPTLVSIRFFSDWGGDCKSCHRGYREIRAEVNYLDNGGQSLNVRTERIRLSRYCVYCGTVQKD